MSAIRELKAGIFFFGGAALTIYGWHFAATTNQIFRGFSWAGPAGFVAGGYFLAKRYGGLRGGILSAIVALALAVGAGGLNTAILKMIYPKALVTNEATFSDSN